MIGLPSNISGRDDLIDLMLDETALVVEVT